MRIQMKNKFGWIADRRIKPTPTPLCLFLMGAVLPSKLYLAALPTLQHTGLTNRLPPHWPYLFFSFFAKGIDSGSMLKGSIFRLEDLDPKKQLALARLNLHCELKFVALII